MRYFAVSGVGSSALVIRARGIPAVQIGGSDAWILIVPQASAAKEAAEKVAFHAAAALSRRF
jgi:hypothetical protein